jgi:hypothetical protein
MVGVFQRLSWRTSECGSIVVVEDQLVKGRIKARPSGVAVASVRVRFMVVLLLTLTE